ncbi:ATP-binding cassette sub-family F member 3 [Marasmius fiardii PR-910]|nr:ATP-binding cassette sub-family F member 3 [Marasmius fiardii PR-910]
MPRDKSSSDPVGIQATSQQTRFDINEDTASKDLDLQAVNISIGKRDILTDSHLKLSPGVHYVLIGRNGIGKSTLMRAIGEKLIPGIPKSMRILMLQQSYNPGGDKSKEEGARTVLDFVVKSDAVRTEALRRSDMLRKALDDHNDPSAAVRAARELKHEDRLRQLNDARKTAQLRSGARGIKARKGLKSLEAQVEEEAARLQQLSLDTVAQEMNEAVLMLADIDAALEAMSASTAEVRATDLLLGLGFANTAILQPLKSLSGGWYMRTVLASLLFQPCDILLLDEPTNFLDMPSLLWLEAHLQERADTTILLVSHDRTFTDSVADEVIVLRDCKLERYPGNLSAYETTRSEQKKRLTRMKEAQDRQKAHMQDTIAGNVRAALVSGDDKKLKQAASRQRKLDERMGMEVGLRGGRFKLNRDLAGYHTNMRADIEIPQDEAAVKITIPSELSDLRFPGALVSVENLTFRYKRVAAPTLNNVKLTVHLGDRIGLVGLNGAGKSTLVSCLVNKPHPNGRILKGTLDCHPKARIGYFSQAQVEELPSSRTALELTMEAHGIDSEHEARAALASMGLTGRTVSDIPIEKLSGGQKVRVALVQILHPSTPHLLVLDEVTTHLDSESVVALARELRAFEGAIVIVSHDRWLIRNVIENEAEESSSEDEFFERTRASEITSGRVRKVYLVGKGEVKELPGGVGDFERKVKNQKKRKRG